MKKNLIALAVTVTLAAGTLVAQAAMYPDVSGNWAQSDIKQVTDMNIMAGFSDGMFHPDAWITRTEYAKMVMKTLGLPYNQVNTVQSVEQVYRNQWAFGPIDNATWVSSYPQGVFRPENPVRRVEAFSGIAGTLTKPLVSDDEATQILSRYSDADQVPVNARRPLATAIKYDLYTIDPKYGSSSLLPLQPITRAEMADLLTDLYNNRDITIASGAPVQKGITTMSSAAVTNPPSGVTTRRYSNQVAYRDALQSWLYGSLPYRSGADDISQLKPNTLGRAIPINTPLTGMPTPAPTVSATNTAACPPLNLPPQSVFTGTVAKALYSEYNQPGDPVLVILDHNILDASNNVIAPAGSRLLGYISTLVPRNPSNEVAEMGIVFSQLLTPEGRRYSLSGVVANADNGIIKADAPQGIVFHPEHSVAALKREINTAEGGWYNTKQAKTWMLNEPYTWQVSNQPIVPIDKTEHNIVIGVGDRLQVRVEGCAPAAPTCP